MANCLELAAAVFKYGAKHKNKYKKVNLYFQDESRFGLITKDGRMLTAKGVKPVCMSHQEYLSTWLFGGFSPITGEHLLMEFPNCNADNFQIFLNEISSENQKNSYNYGIG